MQKNKKVRAERGITLIALIITIIVILILVAVSVRTISKSGLFDHAKEATSKWSDEQEKEANIGDEVGNVIDKYVGQHNWKRNGDNLRCDHCGLSFVIGDYVDYTPDPTTKTITISDEECGKLETSVNNSGSLSNTDVKLASLNTTNNSAKIIQVSNIAHNEFTQNAETYWQVLGIEDSDKNGTNETLLIKMAIGTEETLYLKGKAAYNNGPDIMNRIAKELYSSSKYGEARSINITDINNTLQYTPGGGFYYDSGYKELSGFNTQIKDLPTWNKVKENGTYTPDGTNTEAKLGSYEVNGYFYGLGSGQASLDEKKYTSTKIARMSLTNESQATIIRTATSGPNLSSTAIVNPATEETTNITENTRDIVFLTPTGDTAYYWLACRSVYMLGDYADFGPGSVYDGYVDSFGDTFGSDGHVYGENFPVCPVVSLKSEIPAKIPTPTFNIPEI